VAAFLEREALKARLLALFSKQRDYEAEARKASERQRAMPEWIVPRRLPKIFPYRLRPSVSCDVPLPRTTEMVNNFLVDFSMIRIRKHMPYSFELHVLGVRYHLGKLLSVLNRQNLVVSAMDDERRHMEHFQSIVP
jgi:hypothetical protein